MPRVKRFLIVLAALVLVAVVIVFVLENSQSTHLAFLGWHTPELPLVLFVTLAFILGGIIGLLLNVPLRARARSWRSEASRIRKENQQLRQKSLESQ
ncbi:MAG: Lipopolysaccharide assembly protein A [Pseudomonas delhiensis]|nr:MAG: Lipopolysaccharide assembly protein A [Pseudomonas delhiensis]